MFTCSVVVKMAPPCLGWIFLISARVKLRQADLPTCRCVMLLSFCPPCCAPLWQIGCTLPPSVSSRRTQPTLTTSARTSLSTRGEPLLNCCLCLSVRQSVQSPKCGATQSTASHISRKGEKYYITLSLLCVLHRDCTTDSICSDCNGFTHLGVPWI